MVIHRFEHQDDHLDVALGREYAVGHAFPDVGRDWFNDGTLARTIASPHFKAELWISHSHAGDRPELSH